MTIAYIYDGNHFIHTQEILHEVWVRMNAPTKKELDDLAAALKIDRETLTIGTLTTTIGSKEYRLILSNQWIVTISESPLECEQDEALFAFVKAMMVMTFTSCYVNIDPCDVLKIVNGSDSIVVSFNLETDDISQQLATKLPKDIADATGVIAVFCTSMQYAEELMTDIQNCIGKTASFVWCAALSLENEANVYLILAKHHHKR